MKACLLAILLTASFGMVGMGSHVYAQSNVDVFKGVCSDEPDATVCKEKASAKNSNPLFGPKGLLTRIIFILSIIVGIVAVIGIMTAGLKFITSGNNPQQVTVAREMVLYAIVGLLVAAFAQGLVKFILYRIE